MDENPCRAPQQKSEATSRPRWSAVRTWFVLLAFPLFGFLMAVLAKMTAIIHQLASVGKLVLMLRTTDFVSGRLFRQTIGLSEVSENCLLTFPHDTIVSFSR